MEKALQAAIREEIANVGGVLPFVRFMELALYHPRYGYYMTDRPKVGKQGDFFTSPAVHPVFAETVADAIIDIFAHYAFQYPVLVEAGGGTGHFLATIVERIRQQAHDLYRSLRLIMIEASAYHRTLQEKALASFAGEKRWYPSVEEAAEQERVTGVMISNEWFDAFPVHLLDRQEDGWREVGVAWDSRNERFVEQHVPTLTAEAAAYLTEKRPNVPSGTRIEACPAAKRAVAALAGMLQQGLVITIDYGDTDEGLYQPHRRDGTLMCYYRHQAHTNPLMNIGEQDITAHVNYSDLMRWGEAVGLVPLLLTSQGRFLLASGILDKLQAHTDRDPFTSAAMRRNSAIRQLVEPGGMGGVFRVLIQQKGGGERPPLRFLEHGALYGGIQPGR